jgi:hypothetical protein
MLASFQGLIGYVEIPDFLTFVNLGRRTGVAELVRPEQTTRIFFQQGNPVFAISDKDGLRLGDLLVRLGRMTRGDLDRCVIRYRAGGPHLGQLFVSEGLISAEELSSHLKVQVSEVIFDIFTWSKGTFAFYDDVSPPDDAVTLQMDLQNLIMEGVRRIDERGRLAEIFPDLDAVVVMYGNRDNLRESLNLTPEEWRILFLIDGRRSLREVCQLAGNPDELASLAVLNRLFDGNLIGFAAPRVPAGADSFTRLVAEALNKPATETSELSKKDEPAEVDVEERLPWDTRHLRDRSDADVVVNPKAVQYKSQTIALWARLLVKGSEPPKSFPLSMETQSLGRSPNNNIVISDPVVSTFHARIDRAREGFSLVDLTSTNGTFVNGKRVTTTILKPKDEIQMGAVKLIYLED